MTLNGFDVKIYLTIAQCCKCRYFQCNLTWMADPASQIQIYKILIYDSRYISWYCKVLQSYFS